MPQPTIILDQTTYYELLRVLTPLLVDQNQRQALLWSAFYNSPVCSKINFAGSAHTFTVNLISTLLTYGEISPGRHALMVLLDAARQEVGVNKQQRIQRLQMALAPQLQTRLIIPQPVVKPFYRILLARLQWVAVLIVIALVGFVFWRLNHNGLPPGPVTVVPTTMITPAAQTPIPVTPLVTVAALTPTPLALQAQVVADMQHSAVPNTYPVAANQFVDTLFAHLDDFQLPNLGITRSTVTDALGRPGIGDRINGMVQSVWEEWVGLANRNGFDLNSTEPTYADHQLSPFRQLVIHLCQNRQGKLFDSQQHALYNFLTRNEDPTVWYTPAGTAGVIAAINRDSFQWGLSGP